MPTSICRYLFCTCLLRTDWFLTRSYNEAFRASCLATFLMLNSDFGYALIFAMVIRALRSETCWPAVIMTSVSIPPCVCLLHQMVGRGRAGGMGGGGRGMVARGGKRSKKRWSKKRQWKRRVRLK